MVQSMGACTGAGRRTPQWSALGAGGSQGHSGGSSLAHRPGAQVSGALLANSKGLRPQPEPQSPACT